ncbi:MAG: permease [Clostridia bacterium]|nr:permease [Clostridia bacterium]
MTKLSDISIIFTSIIFEAFPFIMLGVIISAIIQEFVPDDFFKKIMPKNPILGSIVGILMGLFIPSCDCAVIPVARRLIKKGIPLNVGITFMIASPIVNPVVILATFYSFGAKIPSMVFYRTGLGILIAILVGILVSILTKKDEIFKEKNSSTFYKKCSCGCHLDTHEHSVSNNFLKRIDRIIKHTTEELLDITKFLIIGALIASVIQVIIPRSILLDLNANKSLEILVFMVFAYVISLCSTADSFVAKTFINQVTNNSILAFLLLGPMIDIKNTLILFRSYDKKLVFKIIGLIFILVFLISYFVRL